jgi:hypothetical protein
MLYAGTSMPAFLITPLALLAADTPWWFYLLAAGLVVAKGLLGRGPFGLGSFSWRSWSNGDDSGDGWIVHKPRPAKHPPQRARRRPPQPLLGASQSFDQGTGELTSQDLDSGELPAGPVAKREFNEDELLALRYSRRAELRRRLPNLEQQLESQWRQLVEGFARLAMAAQAEPATWRFNAAAGKSAGPAEGLPAGHEEGQPWDAGGGAGPIRLDRSAFTRAAVIDRNGNGIPDHLEEQRGETWEPLTFAERAWLSVLEEPLGPAVVYAGMQQTIDELYDEQMLLGYPARLQGPLEMVRSMLRSALLAADERVEKDRRRQLREVVLDYIRYELPRTNANLGQALARQRRDEV